MVILCSEKMRARERLVQHRSRVENGSLRHVVSEPAGEVIQTNDLGSRGKQMLGNVRSDEACSPCHQCGHLNPLPFVQREAARIGARARSARALPEAPLARPARASPVFQSPKKAVQPSPHSMRHAPTVNPVLRLNSSTFRAQRRG